MRYVICFLLIVMILAVGCGPAAEPPPQEQQAQNVTPLTDDQILQQHPDGLDAAMQELDIVS
ncbi:MAG: hypothetical protein V1735_07310 [Nanoarchaeota archaeon]